MGNSMINQLLNELNDRLNLTYIRFYIILSLFLQVSLNFFAPLRKRTRSLILIVPLWFAYLLSDWTATYSIGLISQKMEYIEASTGYDNLLAFWASFLLLHLGGQDKITAYAVEDNQLWHRNAFTLIAQSFLVMRVLFQSLPNRKLRLPTALVVISGIFKYYERTKSLYLARLNKFRASILKNHNRGVDYEKIMEDYCERREGVVTNKLSDDEVVLYAHQFYDIFKGLIVDLRFKSHQLDLSRKFFLHISAEDAFNVIEVELNFIYEDLFTKARVVHKWSRYLQRIFSFAFITTSLFMFYCEDKDKFMPVDVTLSYTLLLAAVALDLIGLIGIVTSDWATPFIKKLSAESSKKDNTAGKKMTEERSQKRARTPLFEKLVHTWEMRWSEAVPTYSLITHCVRRNSKTEKRQLGPSKIVDLMNIIHGMKYVKHEKFTKDLENHIFDVLRLKSNLPTAKDDWVLRATGQSNLLPNGDFELDQVLLVWHIATELCYFVDDPTGKENLNIHRKFSKILSGYLLYLLVMLPAMISPVIGIGQMRFHHTCHLAETHLRKCSKKDQEGRPKNENVREACKCILKHYPKLHEEIGETDENEILHRGSSLAHNLGEEGEEKWEIISRVWVEMLSYAASHSSAHVHVAELSKGGQLITFVWFLIAHLGLGDQLRCSE